MGKIVTLREVVADVYQDQSPSEVELQFTARPGGAPANVAVAAAKLGAQASFVGRLGNDLFGDFILRALHAVGVDTSAVRREPPPTRTTLAFVEVSEDGDRAFTFYRPCRRRMSCWHPMTSIARASWERRLRTSAASLSSRTRCAPPRASSRNSRSTWMSPSSST